MTLRKIKIGLLALFAVAGLPVVGQDLIARQAPIDRRLKAVDSVSIQKMIEREQKQVAANCIPIGIINTRINITLSYQIALRLIYGIFVCPLRVDELLVTMDIGRHIAGCTEV